MAVDFLACAAVVLGGLEIASQRYQSEVLALSPAETKVMLTAESAHAPLTAELTPEERETFFKLLADNERISPGKPDKRWTCLVRAVSPSDEYVFRLHATRNEGTYAWFFSSGTGGLNYGALRNDRLGPFVEALFAQRYGKPGNPDSLSP